MVARISGKSGFCFIIILDRCFFFPFVIADIWLFFFIDTDIFFFEFLVLFFNIRVSCAIKLGMAGFNQSFGIFRCDINNNTFGQAHAVYLTGFQYPHARPFPIRAISVVHHIEIGVDFPRGHQFDTFFEIDNALTQHVDACSECAKAFGFVFFDFQELLNEGF